MNDKFQELLLRVQRSVNYHGRREGFFNNCHILVMTLAVLAGSSTVAAFGTSLAEGWPLWLKLLPAMLITVFSVIDLAVGFANRAALYGDLKRRFIRIERKLVKIQNNPTEADVVQLKMEVLEVEVEEPQVLHVLNTICRNDTFRAAGYGREEQIDVSWDQRIFAHFFDWDAKRLWHKEHKTQ